MGDAVLIADALDPGGVARLVGLTPAESRVVALVIEGRPNRDVAVRLSVSEHTVEWHLRRIFEKLGVRSRGQLTVLNLAESAGVRV